MYLSELKIWNFRKYGIIGEKFETAEPGIIVYFHEGVNVLVGENDSGKTTIIDAIRYVLKTQSLEYFQLEEKDFHESKSGDRTSELRIECTFSGFSANGIDGSHFLEWIGFDNDNNFLLKVWLYAKRKDNNIFQFVRAGVDSEGSIMEGEARDLLRVIYLKPLRDALSEMTHGNKSRLAQILRSRNEFKKGKDESGKEVKHELEENYGKLKSNIDNFFKEDGKGGSIQKTINDLLRINFFLGNDDRKAGITLTGNDLGDILKQLDLVLEENKSGLGSLNLLFIAAELLLLFESHSGLKLTLIEELEAHLHPQYQLRLIDFIQSSKENFGQFILSTHSTTLASKIDLENLIICNKVGDAFPMGHIHTKLEWGDYSFLQRFLDATKANLFFAKGVILVEGDAENLLIPTLATLIDKPLHKFGVSLVSIGNTAFLRYSRIFLRSKNPLISIPVSVVTDLDIKPKQYYVQNGEDIEIYKVTSEKMDNLTKICTEVDFGNLLNITFTSLNSFNYHINANKTGRISKEKRDTIHAICKGNLEVNDIEILKKSTKEFKEEQFNDQTVKTFVAENWTLEYEIALSSIKTELYEAILRAKFQMSSNEIAIVDDDLKTIKGAVIEFFNKNKALSKGELAFEIYYNTLLKNQISKAITAQYLSEILMQNGAKEKYYDIITNDPYLKYLVDAICYVTDNQSIMISDSVEDAKE
jgi:putative ATP-dependent endonuclease of OLD family